MVWNMHSTIAANHELAQDRRAELAGSPVREALPKIMLNLTRKYCSKTGFWASIFTAAFLFEKNGCLFH
jgi:hypothetical protein